MNGLRLSESSHGLFFDHSRSRIIMRGFLAGILALAAMCMMVGCATGPTKEQLAAQRAARELCEQSIAKSISSYDIGKTTLDEVMEDVKTNDWGISLTANYAQSVTDGSLVSTEHILTVSCASNTTRVDLRDVDAAFASLSQSQKNAPFSLVFRDGILADIGGSGGRRANSGNLRQFPANKNSITIPGIDTGWTREKIE